MKSLRKIILKNFIGGLVFCFTIMLFYFAVKARSGLTATPGDKLLASKRNELVGNVTTLQTKVDALSGVHSVKAQSVKSTGYIPNGATSYQQIPGLSTTLTLDKTALVQIFSNGSTRMVAGTTCHNWIKIIINGVDKSRVIYLQNGTSWNLWNISYFDTLPAGTYNINIQGYDAYNDCLICAEAGPTLTDYSTCYLNVQAFNQ